MLERTAELEVLREVILPVESHHRLALLCIVGVAFERYVHCCSCVEYALVEDCHLACRIVHAVVRPLLQRHSAGGDHHGALRHVVCTERDHVCRRAAILSRQSELVLLGYLLRDRLGGVVKFGIAVFCRLVGRYALCNQGIVEIFSERLSLGEEHASVAHGVSLHVVEVSVAVRLVVIVQTVGSQELNHRHVLHLLFGNVREVHAGGVALVFHVEAELVLLHR